MKKYDFKYKPIQKTGEKEIISVIGSKEIDLYYFYPKTNEREFIKTVKVKDPFKKD
tara:strand:+ start:6654 stop:6821 length:168 start_codon:yes stop_codon:yes gene_type:complete